jgi:hypothetical protein
VIQLGTSLRTLAHLFLKETKHLHKEEKSWLTMRDTQY